MNNDSTATVKGFETKMSEDMHPLETQQSIDIDVATNSMDTDQSETEHTAMTDTPVEQELQAQAVDSLEPELAENSEIESSAEILAPDPEDVEADALTRLATEVESLRLQVEERTSQCMRMAADFDNFRKRTEREKSELELRVKRDAISELLPVIDSFERARTQIKPQSEEEVNIHKSYQGVYKQLVDCLKRIGVSPMRVEGEPFDPNYHDAIMREPTDQHPEGVILEELRRGYLLGEMVLRHAMVKVSALPETDSSAAAVIDESEPSLNDSISS